MNYYFVAQISITDHEEYWKYLENFDEIFSKYKGEYLQKFMQALSNITKTIMI